MADKQSGGSKGCKKKGRAAKKPTHARYVSGKKCQHNKLKRVFQSSGYKAANEFSKQYGVSMPQYMRDAAK